MKIDISNLAKTTEMLDEEKFWQIISNSLKDSKNEFEQKEKLVDEISKLKPKEMIGFKLRTDALFDQIYTSEMWCAAWILNGFCSDDGFVYFRLWLISKGKEPYYNTLENPDSLAHEVNERRKLFEFEFEDFWSVAGEAFELKTGKDLYDFIDMEELSKGRELPILEFNWEGDEPETMKKICPKLFEKFWV